MIDEKAQELGRLIGQSDDYKALKRARELVRQAGELTLRLDRLRQAAETLEQHASDGKEPPADTVDAYNQVVSEIQGDSRYQRLVAAETNFDKLMLRVNEHIAEGMEKGAQSSIITLS